MSTMEVQNYEPEENYGDADGEYDYDDVEEEEEYVEEEYYEEEEHVEEIEEDVAGQEEEPAAGGMAAMIAAAAAKRKQRIDEGGEVKVTEVAGVEQEDDDDEEEPVVGGMAAMIAAAAAKRNQRIDDGGEVKLTELKGPAPPPSATNMADMVANLANKRNERIEAGGEVQVREIPEEHKNVFVSVAGEAARVGLLTRLNEHFVEAVAVSKEEEVWGGPSGLRTDNYRSKLFMVINEAAAVGQMKRLKAVEVTNYDANIQEEEEWIDVDKLTDENGRRVVRTEYLLDQHVNDEKKEKHRTWAPETALSAEYTSIDDVVLPSRKVPGFKPKKMQLSQKEAMDAISAAVAERAWERNYRLGRPKAQLRVTRKCECNFCFDPNPFQTHKYKQLHKEGITEVVEGKVMEHDDPAKKKWQPPKRSAPPIITDGGRRPKPSELPKLKPVPFPKPMPRAPAPARKPQAAPEPQAEPELEEEPEPTGPQVLLDETVTYGHKRLKPKKDKEKKKKKTKKKKKKDDDGGCSIM
jgi:hypothetical protein